MGRIASESSTSPITIHASTKKSIFFELLLPITSIKIIFTLMFNGYSTSFFIIIILIYSKYTKIPYINMAYLSYT
jgi:hypothetical protein